MFFFKALLAGQPIGSHTIKIFKTGTTTLVPAGDLYDLDGAALTNPFTVDDAGGQGAWGFIYQGNERVDVYWVENDELLQKNSVEEGYFSIFGDTMDPTGFVDNGGIGITYDKATRKVTLTHSDLRARWRGSNKPFASPLESVAHDPGDGVFFLHSSDGVNFSWSTNVWPFSDLLVAVAIVLNSGADAFALREVHGMMPHNSHAVLHERIGTHRVSGLGPTSGTYVLDTATDAATTPDFDAGVIRDEDSDTPIAATAVATGTYTTLRIGAAGVPTFDTAATFPFRSSGSYPLINNPTDGSEAATVAKRFFNVYEILVPVTDDTESQKYRRLLLQPQTVYTSLASAQAENTLGLSLGTFSAPEYLLYSRLTYETAASDANTGKCRLQSITSVAGTRASQVANISGLIPTAENIPYTPTAPDTSTNLQASTDARLLKSGDTIANVSESTSSVTFTAGAGSLNVETCDNIVYGEVTQNSTLTLTGTMPEGKSISLIITHSGGAFTLAVGTSGNEADANLQGASDGDVEVVILSKFNSVIRRKAAGLFDGVVS